MYIVSPYIPDVHYKSPNQQLPTCCCPIRKSLSIMKGGQNGKIQKHLHIKTVQEDFPHKSIPYLGNKQDFSNEFIHQLTFIINQLYLQITFPCKSAILVNQLSLSINFPHPQCLTLKQLHLVLS